MSREFWRVTAALSRRSMVRFARQPTTWVPGLAGPLLLAAVNSSAVSRAREIPGFPTGATYLQFLVPTCILQGVMFGAVAEGTELATDIQTGFFDRLVVSPASRSAMLLGRLAGTTAFAVAQASVYVALLRCLGAEIHGGVAGASVLVSVAGLLAFGAGGFAAGLAARTGHPEAVQGFFPLGFMALFLSSCFFPTALMDGWYRRAAEHNPITPMVDGLRHQVIVGFDASQAVRSLLVGGAIVVIGAAFAAMQLRHRLRQAG